MVKFKKSKLKKLVIGALLFAASCQLASCNSHLAGGYTSTAGSYLELRSNGTCIYAEPDETGAGTGTWYIEDDIIYIDANNLEYTIYGNVEDADNGILLKSSSGNWIDEYFIKND